MEKFKAFCKRKNIEVSAKRYGIDALGAMAQGLFCSLLIGTISQDARRAAGRSVSDGHRHLCDVRLRPCDGGRHRLRAQG